MKNFFQKWSCVFIQAIYPAGCKSGSSGCVELRTNKKISRIQKSMTIRIDILILVNFDLYPIFFADIGVNPGARTGLAREGFTIHLV